jgi:hypothetical protein
MAKCSYCGADTLLFVNETPLCLGCAHEAQLQLPKTPKKESELKAAEPGATLPELAVPEVVARE